jgi:predicted secreted hydrolase
VRIRSAREQSRQPRARWAAHAASCTFSPAKPTPAPGPSTIKLPADQANHPDVDTEWWFLIGTVKSGDRTFGVEVNIARFANAIAQSYVKIADVNGGKNYAEVLAYPMSELKAAANEFSAELPNAAMSGPLDAMKVSARLPAGTIDLRLSQAGPPLVVFGTGRQDLGGFITNYYALTNITAKGTLTLNGQSFDVGGLLWMDHQYGGWGKHVTWGWTGTQLENGVSIMAFTSAPTEADKPQSGLATILMPDGTEFLEPVTMTPRNPTFTSETTREVYFTGWTLAIPGHNACLDIVSSPADQEFITPAIGKVLPAGGVYEAVSTATGTWDGKPVAGQSWNEQAQ